MDRTAEYNDYVRDVCGFLRKLAPADADWILNDTVLVASLWRKTVAGWNQTARPAQIAADWYGDYIDKTPVVGVGPITRVAPVVRWKSDIPADILANREKRRLLWKAAYLTS